MSDRTITIPKPCADEIVAHARDEAPNECCGMLAGKGDAIAKVYRATNMDRSPVKYTIDPKDIMRIDREAAKAGFDIVAFYHSHTFTEAYPSVTDVKLVGPNSFFDYVYVIVSLSDQGKPSIRAFKIVNGDVSEIPVMIGN